MSTTTYSEVFRVSQQKINAYKNAYEGLRRQRWSAKQVEMFLKMATKKPLQDWNSKDFDDITATLQAFYYMERAQALVLLGEQELKERKQGL